MRFSPTTLPDVVVIDPEVFKDERGFLMETFQVNRFREAGIDAVFVQDVHSRSAKGVVRGLHYQLKQPQGKLVRAIAGELFDVAVDLRRSSTTFGQWVGITLSAANRRMIWIPPGFAHGFMVLSKYADIEYRMTDFHAADDARTVLWDDADIGVKWPVAKVGNPILSNKDLTGESFRDAECYA